MTDSQSILNRIFSAFRRPSWRWLEAGHILETRARTPAKYFDDIAKVVIEYRRALAHCRSDADLARLEERWPHLRQAQLLAEGDVLLRAEVEARVLAQQTDVEVAELCGLEPDCVAWFERVFFAVRGLFDAHGWITVFAVGAPPYGVYDRNDLPVLWRSFARSGGPGVLDAVLAVTDPLPGRRKQLDPLLELLVKLSIAAMTARNERELAKVLALGRRVRQITGRDAANVQVCGEVLHLLGRLPGQQTGPSPRRSRKPVADDFVPDQIDVAAELQELGTAVEQLEGRMAAAHAREDRLASNSPTST